jgi:hypothetical protein
MSTIETASRKNKLAPKTAKNRSFRIQFSVNEKAYTNLHAVLSLIPPAEQSARMARLLMHLELSLTPQQMMEKLNIQTTSGVVGVLAAAKVAAPAAAIRVPVSTAAQGESFIQAATLAPQLESGAPLSESGQLASASVLEPLKATTQTAGLASQSSQKAQEQAVQSAPDPAVQEVVKPAKKSSLNAFDHH